MKAAIREEKEERPNQQNLASGPVSFCKFVSRTRTNIYYTGNRIGTKRHRVAADLSHAFPITEEAALLPIWSTSSPFPKFGQHWTRFGTVFVSRQNSGVSIVLGDKQRGRSTLLAAKLGAQKKGSCRERALIRKGTGEAVLGRAYYCFVCLNVSGYLRNTNLFLARVPALRFATF